MVQQYKSKKTESWTIRIPKWCENQQSKDKVEKSVTVNRESQCKSQKCKNIYFIAHEFKMPQFNQPV